MQPQYTCFLCCLASLGYCFVLSTDPYCVLAADRFCCIPTLLLKCCCNFSSHVQEQDNWKKFGARIMASCSEPNPMMTIRAMRLNGELLELKLSDSELADLRTVRDLKVRLAAADPSSPCPLDRLRRSPYLLLDSQSSRYCIRYPLS